MLYDLMSDNIILKLPRYLENSTKNMIQANCYIFSIDKKI